MHAPHEHGEKVLGEDAKSLNLSAERLACYKGNAKTTGEVHADVPTGTRPATRTGLKACPRGAYATFCPLDRDNALTRFSFGRVSAPHTRSATSEALTMVSLSDPGEEGSHSQRAQEGAAH